MTAPLRMVADCMPNVVTDCAKSCTAKVPGLGNGYVTFGVSALAAGLAFYYRSYFVGGWDWIMGCFSSKRREELERKKREEALRSMRGLGGYIKRGKKFVSDHRYAVGACTLAAATIAGAGTYYLSDKTDGEFGQQTERSLELDNERTGETPESWFTLPKIILILVVCAAIGGAVFCFVAKGGSVEQFNDLEMGLGGECEL